MINAPQKNFPLVSIIIPVYNAEKYIREAINSALNQTYPNIEVIIVDDGSTDGTPHILGEYTPHPRIRILFHENRQNRGVSRTRKLGIDQAKGKYIAFLDADDIFLPNKIAIQVKALQQNPDVVLCHTAVSLVSNVEPPPNLEEYFDLSPKVYKYPYSKEPYFLKHNIICNSSAVVLAESLKELPFASRQLFQYEDWLLWILMAENKNLFLYLPDKLTRYRFHSSSYIAQSNVLEDHYAKLETYLRVIGGLKSDKLRLMVIGQLNTQLAEIFNLYLNSSMAMLHLPGKVLEVSHKTFYEDNFATQQPSHLSTLTLESQEPINRLSAKDISQRISIWKIVKAIGFKVAARLGLI